MHCVRVGSYVLGAPRRRRLGRQQQFVQQQLEGFPIKDEEGDEKIDFINLDAESAWVERKVTATLEDRLERLLKVLAKVRAERDSLQDLVSAFEIQIARFRAARDSALKPVPMDGEEQ